MNVSQKTTTTPKNNNIKIQVTTARKFRFISTMLKFSFVDKFTLTKFQPKWKVTLSKRTGSSLVRAI